MMNSFTDTIKKHGLIIWLSHLLAALVMYGVVFLLFVGGLLTFLGVGVTMSNITTDKLLELLKTIPSVALGGTAVLLAILAMLVMLVIYLATSFGKAGTIAVTSNAVSRDEATIGMFFRQGLKFMWRMLGLALVSGLTFIPTALVGMGTVFMFMKNYQGIGVLLGLLTLALGILTTLGLLFAQYILIAENASISHSIGGSFILLKKAFGKVLVTGLIPLAIGLAFGIPMFISSIGWKSDGHTAVFNPVYDFLLSPIIMGLVTIFFTYRYFRYMRPVLYPTTVEVEHMDVKDEMDKTEY